MFPDIAKEPRFTLDRSGYFFSNTGYAIPSDDLYLLGVLNSSIVEDIYRAMSAQIRGGYLRFFAQYVEKIPIPKAAPSDVTQISLLVEECLKAQGRNVQSLGEELDKRIARLFEAKESDSTSGKTRSIAAR